VSAEIIAGLSGVRRAWSARYIALRPWAQSRS
jgi:hypothetical protein